MGVNVDPATSGNAVINVFSTGTVPVNPVEKEEAGGFEEISFDATTLNPSCLVPPTIPNTLGADDIDKVKLINVRVKVNLFICLRLLLH